MSNPAHRHTVPAFREFVTRPFRIAIFVAFALIFQFSNTAYLSLTGSIVAANQMLKEDLTFLNQMTMVGICFVYPLLFRLKLRFTSQQIITGSSITVMLAMFTVIHTDSIAVLALASLLLGAAKMLGSFETLVSIQLIITPNKDYGVFFSVALGIVLLSGQISGTWAIGLNYDYDWTAVYKIMIAANAAVILLSQLLLRPLRAVKQLPLYGIDWLGCFFWCCLFTALTYLFSYGQLLDWFSSGRIQQSAWLSLFFGLLTFIRVFSVRRPYVSAEVFTIRSVNIAILVVLLLQLFLSASNSVLSPFTTGMLHLDDLNTGRLNWYTALGIAAGSLFSYFWFLRINGPFKIFFCLAFSCLTCYYLLLYFLLSSYADMQVLAVPYFLRGFANMLVFAGVGKYITRNIRLDLFMQVLCYLAMVRNALGRIIPGSLIAYIEYWRTLDFHNKLAGKIDSYSPAGSTLYQSIYNKAILSGTAPSEAAILANRSLFAKVNQQSVMLAGREIFGIMVLLGIVVIFLLGTVHFGSPFIRRIPSWKKVRTALSKKI